VIALILDGETTETAQTDAVADGLWTVVRALSNETRERLLEKMLADPSLREEIEDLLDLAIADERSHEPSQPLVEVISDTA
jgi:hypothetical protein